MSTPIVKFNTKDQPEFFRELRKRVNEHFNEKGISKHANLNMVIKTIFMVSLYFVPLFLMVTGVVTSGAGIFLLWVLMGFGMSGIGLSVMHDANHGSYSANPKVNSAIGFIINFIGGYHANWKIQHNVLHHSYTNIEGFDDDINKKQVFRLSPNQEQKKFYKYQAFYAPFFYGLMTIYWFLGKDYQQLYKYNDQNLLAGQGLTFKQAFIEITFHKIWYLALVLVLPIVMVALPWWQTVLGFLMMHFMSGIILALIFQPAHVIEETSFFEADAHGSVENHWAIHQLMTTANFANKSRVFSWLVGGLNFQIEHHLFPHICHVHYRHISEIVKTTAKEYNIPYYEHETFYGAVRSHFVLLDKLGTGQYDRELAAVC